MSRARGETVFLFSGNTQSVTRPAKRSEKQPFKPTKHQVFDLSHANCALSTSTLSEQTSPPAFPTTSTPEWKASVHFHTLQIPPPFHSSTPLPPPPTYQPMHMGRLQQPTFHNPIQWNYNTGTPMSNTQLPLYPPYYYPSYPTYPQPWVSHPDQPQPPWPMWDPSIPLDRMSYQGQAFNEPPHRHVHYYQNDRKHIDFPIFDDECQEMLRNTN